MRPIHVVQLDKPRPAVILTRQEVLPVIRSVTVAPITTRIRGLHAEVAVGVANGLETDSVINCDNIVTVDGSDVGRLIGYLLPHQEQSLTDAISSAFALE